MNDQITKTPPNEELERIKQAFKSRCIEQKVKFKSAKFYNMQLEFFAGVMAALDYVHPSWYLLIMAHREIIEY